MQTNVRAMSEPETGLLKPSLETQLAIQKWIEEVGSTNLVAKACQSSRESIARISGGLSVRRGTLMVVEAALSNRRG